MEYDYLINYRYKDVKGNDKYSYVVYKARDWQEALAKFKKKNKDEEALNIWAKVI